MPSTFVEITLLFEPPAPESNDYPCRIAETVRCRLDTSRGAAPAENQIADQLSALGHAPDVCTRAAYAHRALPADAKTRPWNSETETRTRNSKP